MAAAVALRRAAAADIPAIEALIADSARGLSPDYAPEQVEGALAGAFGVDRQLIADGSYFVVEGDGRLAACGGWSYRATLFGGDAQPGRSAARLDPATHPARIRAFFVHPDFARRGIGRMLLAACEDAARAAGFREAALMATLPGVRLYAACGYVAGAGETHVSGGVPIDFVPMRKSLAA